MFDKFMDLIKVLVDGCCWDEANEVCSLALSFAVPMGSSGVLDQLLAYNRDIQPHLEPLEEWLTHKENT